MTTNYKSKVVNRYGMRWWYISNILTASLKHILYFIVKSEI